MTLEVNTDKPPMFAAETPRRHEGGAAVFQRLFVDLDAAPATTACPAPSATRSPPEEHRPAAGDDHR
jgi:hypothetical protein